MTEVQFNTFCFHNSPQNVSLRKERNKSKLKSIYINLSLDLISFPKFKAEKNLSDSLILDF